MCLSGYYEHFGVCYPRSIGLGMWGVASNYPCQFVFTYAYSWRFMQGCCEYANKHIEAYIILTGCCLLAFKNSDFEGGLFHGFC